jgi:hypothetical protein
MSSKESYVTSVIVRSVEFIQYALAIYLHPLVAVTAEMLATTNTQTNTMGTPTIIAKTSPLTPLEASIIELNQYWCLTHITF